MRYRETYLIFLLLLSTLLSFSQSQPTADFIRSVQQADMYLYYYEDFYRAAELYEPLLEKSSDHHNLSAKLAICYINIPGRSHEAIPLLSHASDNIAASEMEYTEFGEKAPVETLFYLAYAWHVNDSLDRAIELYTNVIESLTQEDFLRIDYINMQIEACKLAKKLIANQDISLQQTLFTPFLSDFPSAANPVLSENDSVFLFTVRDKDRGIRVYCSYKNQQWEEPEDITDMLGRKNPEMIPNSITREGDFLVLYIFDGGEGNIYYSERTGTEWSRAKRFPKPVTSRYWESFGFITPDGKKLYFTSNRPGGQGGLDIYISEQNQRGRWSEPVNPGKSVNTPYNETTPFYNQQSSLLLFSSEGHRGPGGYSLFSSKNINRGWSKAELLPYPISTTSNNINIRMLNSDSGYLAARVDTISNRENIYRIEMIAQTTPLRYEIYGVVLPADGDALSSKLLKMKLEHVNTGESYTVVINDSLNNTFSAGIDTGNYLLTTSHSGYITDSLYINAGNNYGVNEIYSEIVLSPDEIVAGDFIMIKSVLFDFDSYALSEEAEEELMRMGAMTAGIGGLTVEISGYTDSIGSQEYNKKLAGLRADAVISKLREYTGDDIKYIKRSVGATDFIAANRFGDGSDNKEGRRFNRRVTIGFINGGTGITITPERFVPLHLRHPQSERFAIVLANSTEKLYPDYFRILEPGEMLFIKPMKTEEKYLYVLGDFSSRNDAMQYLKRAKEKGFSEAYVTSRYELLAEDPLSISGKPAAVTGNKPVPLYTIQLFAGRNMTDTNLFEGLTYAIHLGNDGLYRYLTGEYRGFSLARESLKTIRQRGFSDAFIRDYRKVMSLTKDIIKEK